MIGNVRITFGQYSENTKIFFHYSLTVMTYTFPRSYQNLMHAHSQFQHGVAVKDSSSLSLAPTSDVRDVSGIVSEIGIARTLRSSGNQNDVSDGSRSGVGRKTKPSDPSDSDSVALPIPIATPFFDFH